jgi:hypothetical protein
MPIDIEGTVPRLARIFDERATAANARVIEQEVDLWEGRVKGNVSVTR